jgi:hypothetical protein
LALDASDVAASNLDSLRGLSLSQFAKPLALAVFQGEPVVLAKETVFVLIASVA